MTPYIRQIIICLLKWNIKTWKKCTGWGNTAFFSKYDGVSFMEGCGNTAATDRLVDTCWNSIVLLSSATKHFFRIASHWLSRYDISHYHLVQQRNQVTDCVIHCICVGLCNGVSRRACRWDINLIQNQHGLALLVNFSLKCQTHIKIKWRISKSVFIFSMWFKLSSFFIISIKIYQLCYWWWFWPQHLEAGGSLSLPASVCLSVCLFVPMPVYLSVRLSVLPHTKFAITRETFFFHFYILDWSILWVNVSDKFDDGYRSSFDKGIIELIFVLSCLHINSQPSSLNISWIQHVIIMNRRSFNNWFSYWLPAQRIRAFCNSLRDVDPLYFHDNCVSNDKEC